MLVRAYYLAQMCQDFFHLDENFKRCIAMTSLLLAGKYGNLNKFCKFHLGEGVNAILKKVGLYLQNDSNLISKSPYIIKLASKLKLIYTCSTFIRWDGLIYRLII